jgi:hypothetical protein
MAVALSAGAGSALFASVGFEPCGRATRGEAAILAHIKVRHIHVGCRVRSRAL